MERLLELERPSLEIVTREVNDELNCLSSAKDSREKEEVTPNYFPSVPASSAAGSIFKNLGKDKFRFTVEDVVRRVEDMARLHA